MKLYYSTELNDTFSTCLYIFYQLVIFSYTQRRK